MRLVYFFAPIMLILYLNMLNAVMCVKMLHTHCLMNISSNSFTLNIQIDLTSISMSKNDPKLSKLDKYDVEANIEEVENGEDRSIFKYVFTALSNPKNVRLSIEGIVDILGDSIEREEILSKDENEIPKILTTIYQELFPTFFLLSKTLHVSCPPHQIGTIGESSEKDTELTENGEKVENDSSAEIPLESEPKVQEDSKELENPDVAQSTV